jgi:hypothetical protein
MAHANARLGLLYSVGELGDLISLACRVGLSRLRPTRRGVYLSAGLRAVSGPAGQQSWGW